MGTSCLLAATAVPPDVSGRIAAITEQANSSPMQTVAEGPFLMGTARTHHELFSLDLQYNNRNGACGSPAMTSTGMR